MFQFTQLTLKDDDIVTVYDGFDKNADVISHYGFWPYTDSFHSTTSTIYLAFSTNMQHVANGFVVQWIFLGRC